MSRCTTPRMLYDPNVQTAEIWTCKCCNWVRYMLYDERTFYVCTHENWVGHTHTKQETRCIDSVP